MWVSQTAAQAGCVGVGALAVYLAVNWTSGGGAPAAAALPPRRSAPAALCNPSAPSAQDLPARHSASFLGHAADPAMSGSDIGPPHSAAAGRSSGGAPSGGAPSVDAETWRSAVAATAVGRQAAAARSDVQDPVGTEASLSPPASAGAACSTDPQCGHRGAPHWSVREGIAQDAAHGGVRPNPNPGSAASTLEGVPFARVLPWLLRRSIG